MTVRVLQDHAPAVLSVLAHCRTSPVRGEVPTAIFGYVVPALVAPALLLRTLLAPDPQSHTLGSEPRNRLPPDL
jgi:hypothetical protein